VKRSRLEPAEPPNRSQREHHVCVDDDTRLAYVEVLDDEKGITVAGYRSILHAIACRTLSLRHLRTRPYRPRTNGNRMPNSEVRRSPAFISSFRLISSRGAGSRAAHRAGRTGRQTKEEPQCSSFRVVRVESVGCAFACATA
jgi:hypothetical protein